METVTLKDLFYDKECAGWAIPVGDKYAWQNTNDLGLLDSIDDCDEEINVLEKIDLDKKHYIAILENRDNISAEQLGLGPTSTKEEMVACIKDCYGLEMSEEEQKLADTYYKF